MSEPPNHGDTGTGDFAEFVSAVRGLLDRLGSPTSEALAEIVWLYRSHPRWAVWLPADGQNWAAVRPAGSRDAGPEVPMLWVFGETAAELSARMRVADEEVLPGYG